MSRHAPDSFPTLDPALQVSFYYHLQAVRSTCLTEALGRTVERLGDVASLDRELASLVRPKSLARVARFGVRGEIVFAVPLLITANPFLLGYYRLLMGFSQKEFYNKGPFGRFRCLEESGDLPSRLAPFVPALCSSLIGSAEIMVGALDEFSSAIAHELQLLTLGPQMRGRENTRIGRGATREVFRLIRDVVEPHLREETERMLILENASGRMVAIEFGSDPDVRITEKLTADVRPTLSIEIKGGGDVSNVHNRLGEAEKSHQKARRLGFREFWTILRVDVNPETAARESPTTSRFFHLDRICDPDLPDHPAFRDQLAAFIGIRV